MHGEAYKQSSIVARDHGGPFWAYDENREPFLRVINKHRDAAYKIPSDQAVPADMIEAARAVYDEALELGEQSRLPQRPGHRPRPDRHDRLHDGLRYDRRRAGHRPHQVQEARRRGLPQDRQPDGPVGPPQARLRRRAGRRRSSTTSTSTRRSRARRTSSHSTCRSSTARSSRPTASARSTTWATSG